MELKQTLASYEKKLAELEGRLQTSEHEKVLSFWLHFPAGSWGFALHEEWYADCAASWD